jgi:hypothetical protein
MVPAFPGWEHGALCEPVKFSEPAKTCADAIKVTISHGCITLYEEKAVKAAANIPFKFFSTKNFFPSIKVRVSISLHCFS